MPKFFRARVIKTGTSLTNKLNETWFAVKGRGLEKKEIKEFRDYLNECATEFLTEDKEAVDNATDPCAKVGDSQEGTRETCTIKKARKSAPWD